MKQYKFNLKDECMKELPSMEEPIIGDYAVSFGKEHQIDSEVYKEHLASLQSIPVSKNYLSSFTDGKVYNEDEFEICKYQGETFAASIPKQKENDTELWNEAALILFKKYNPGIDFNSEIGRRLFKGFKKDSDELKKYFTITRKIK